jgi:hypothetical protein
MDLDPAHAEPHLSADLQELEPDGAAGRGGELGLPKPDPAQRVQQDVGEEANPSRTWLARMVAAEVRSTKRSSCCSLIRFSTSPRAQ